MVLLLFPSLEGLWGSAVLSLARSLEALVLVYRRREGPPARMGPSRLDLFCTGVTTSVAVDREVEAVPVAASSLPPFLRAGRLHWWADPELQLYSKKSYVVEAAQLYP